MFSSSSANFDPFQYSTIDTPNPNSAPFLNFPFLHGNEELLLYESLTQHNQHQQISPASQSAAKANPEMNPSASKKAKKKTKTKDLKQQTTPRKRTGKKDRHSKIYTAKGPRDRRMRLSLQIARKFFDLQDMLGFDKASKTIDWLLSKSKSAIQEVTSNFSKLKRSESVGGRTVSCSSESEVMSGVKLAAEKRINETEIAAVSVSPAKESRDKARARARERTKEKLKSKRIAKSKEANPRKLDQLDPKEKTAGAGTCIISNMDSNLGVTAATKSASILDLSHLNVANFEEKFSGNVRAENPDSLFMANPNSTLGHKTNIPNLVFQDQNLTSLLMAPDEQNPSFHFMNFSNSTHQISTSLFPMSAYFTDNHFSSTTPNLPFKFDGSLF